MAYDLGTLGGYPASDPRNNIGRGSLSSAAAALKNKVKSWGRSNQPELPAAEPIIDLSGPIGAVAAWDDRQRNGSPVAAVVPAVAQAATLGAATAPVAATPATPVVAPAPMDFTAANNQAKLGAVQRPMDVIQPAAPVVAPVVNPAIATDASRAAYAADPNSVENQSIARMKAAAPVAPVLTPEQVLNGIQSGNTTWDMARPDQQKLADATVKQGTDQQALGIDAGKTAAVLEGQKLGLEGQKYTADAGVTGHKIGADATLGATKLTADAHVIGTKLTADAAIEGHRLGADATLGKARYDQSVKDADAETKNITSVLTNGYGVAPTPEAVKAFKTHQTNLSAWDKETTKMIGAHTKANPADGAAIKTALIAFHRNPTDKAAIEGVKAAQGLLSGNGAGQVPAWFDNALKMPILDTSGMQTWKQPQTAILGE